MGNDRGVRSLVLWSAMARVGIGLFLLMLLATGAMLGIGLVAAFEGVPMQALALALGASFWLMAFLFALSIVRSPSGSIARMPI
jgi:hypothetical protein